MGRADAVLISHAHFDHLDLPTLKRIQAPRRIVVPSGAGPYVDALASSETQVRELEIGRSLSIGELEITAVAAAHNGNRLHPFHSRERAVGYIIRGPRGSLYFAGDTGSGAAFADLRERYHPDVAILPIGAYAPRSVLGPYHLSPEQAVSTAETLGVEVVFPSHFGTFTLSLDHPSWALPRFAREAHRRGIAWRMPVLWQHRGPEPFYDGIGS